MEIVAEGLAADEQQGHLGALRDFHLRDLDAVLVVDGEAPVVGHHREGRLGPRRLAGGQERPGEVAREEPYDEADDQEDDAHHATAAAGCRFRSFHCSHL